MHWPMSIEAATASPIHAISPIDCTWAVSVNAAIAVALW